METLEVPEKKEINWQQYNYPPLLKLIHFRPSELPQDRKTLIMMLFFVHVLVLINTILSIVDNCIEGGIRILYAFLWFFIFNPIIMFLFYRAYIGLCKTKSRLNLYLFIQPVIIIVQVVISIIDFLCFNGFIMVSTQFNEGNPLAGILGLVSSIIYLGVGLLSVYIYYRICRARSALTQTLL